MTPATSHRIAPARLLFPAQSLFEDFYVLGALSGFVVLLASWSHPLWGAAWGAYCPFLALTDIPCPTCYGTRAMLAATSGRWFAALRLNPLVATGGIGLFAYVPWAVGTVVGGWLGRIALAVTVVPVALRAILVVDDFAGIDLALRAHVGLRGDDTRKQDAGLGRLKARQFTRE